MTQPTNNELIKEHNSLKKLGLHDVVNSILEEYVVEKSEEKKKEYASMLNFYLEFAKQNTGLEYSQIKRIYLRHL